VVKIVNDNICIDCKKNEITHRNKELCDDCYKILRTKQKKDFLIANKDKYKEYNKIYRENNKEKISQINKNWYLKPENKERKRLQNKARNTK